MKKVFLIALLIPLMSFSQSKFGITGSFGLFSMDKDVNLGLNGSLNYTLKENAFTTGIDIFGSRNRVNSENVDTDQYFAFLEYGNPKHGFKGDNYYFSYILGPGIINQRAKTESVTEFSMLVATKFNIKVGSYTIFGLKTGFMFNKIDPCAFANLFVSYRF